MPQVDVPLPGAATMVASADDKCSRCTGTCCTYFGLEIDKPTDAADFDQLLWYLLHTGTEIYVDEGHWFLNVTNTCRHLLPDHRCGIYETRPQVCREYDTATCEFENVPSFDLYFRTYDELVTYLRGRGIGGTYLRPGEVLPKRPKRKVGTKAKAAAKRAPKKKSRARAAVAFDV